MVKPVVDTIEARRDFRRDRFGHNNKGPELCWSRITYLASAKGWVMARRPGATPFAIPEALWRSFAYWGLTPAVSPIAGEITRRDWPARTIQFGGGRKGGKTAALESAATEVLIGESPNPLLAIPHAPRNRRNAGNTSKREGTPRLAKPGSAP